METSTKPPMTATAPRSHTLGSSPSKATASTVPRKGCRHWNAATYIQQQQASSPLAMEGIRSMHDDHTGCSMAAREGVLYLNSAVLRHQVIMLQP